jgi:hypothetical protein
MSYSVHSPPGRFLSRAATFQGATPEARVSSYSEAMKLSSLVDIDHAGTNLSRCEKYVVAGRKKCALADYDELVCALQKASAGSTWCACGRG